MPRKSLTKVNWRNHLYTVTPLSKILALALFIIIPITTFFFGISLGQLLQQASAPESFVTHPQPTPLAGTGCKLESRICPDGSYVGRSGPNCEFAACTTALPTPNLKSKDDSVMCTMDAMMCPDGTYVGRTGPNCEFVCPTTTDN